MLIYIFVFAISVFFTRLCEGSERKFHKFAFASFAVLIPALLAGFRDYGVGHDTTIYVEDTVLEVLDYKDSDLLTFIKATIEGEFTQEKVYCFLNYVALQIGSEVNYVYFVINLVTIALVFNAIYLYREKASMPLMMCVFLFLYFNLSLNIIRQSVAMALALNVYLFLEQKKWKTAFGFLAVMLLSHNTSVVFSLFLLLYAAIHRNALKKVIFGIILIIPVSLMILDYLIMVAISLNIVSLKFMVYMIDEEKTAIMKTAVVFGWIVLGAMFWFGRSFLKKKETSREIALIFNVKLCSNILILASTISLWAFRMAYYFGIFDVLFIPRIIRLVYEEDEKKGRLSSLLIVSLIILYWYWSIIHNNENETYPYKSALLGL